MTSPVVAPFSIAIGEEVLEDLRQRIRRTRWPDQVPGAGWTQGTELEFLERLLAHWAGGFDWRAQERELNRFRHFSADIEGVRIHFVHEKARGGSGIPLILTHGWPSSFVEYLRVLPLLTDPAAHGIEGPGFDVVIPSLPGYGFSRRPLRTGVNYRSTAALWRQLMRALGYQRYGAGGGDFGAGVASYIALDEPERVIGLHLTNLELAPHLGPGSRPLSEAERAYLAENQRWADVERGYSSIQSTKPQTVGYGLNDSPAGLAAWILEKWRSWTDSKGDVETRFSREFLLTLLTIYWATQTITPSMRDYLDNRFHGAPLGARDLVRVPTAVAVFAHEHVPEGEPPREWAERLYDVRRWTRMPRGGHFAPAEEPELVARDLAAFFGSL
jgi:pimeloyl-ACP methyl ester carboxylesterase